MHCSTTSDQVYIDHASQSLLFLLAFVCNVTMEVTSDIGLLTSGAVFLLHCNSAVLKGISSEALEWFGDISEEGYTYKQVN